MTTAIEETQFVFDAASHTYHDCKGLLLPSVTQVLKAEGFINFDGIPHHILERKRQLGTLVHQATQLLDQGEELAQFVIPSEVLEYVDGYINFKNDCLFEPDPEFIEHRMIGELFRMRYGMTLDRRGNINGIRHIIELKCGASEHPAWGLQLAGYDTGVNATHGRAFDARAAVQLGPQFPRGYKIHPYEESSDYQVWMNSLANTIWKMNHRLYSPEPVPERLAA